MLPIVVAASVCGEGWSGKIMRDRYGSQSVVVVINAGSCKEAGGNVPVPSFLEARE